MEVVNSVMLILAVWFIYGMMITDTIDSYDDYGDDNKVIIKQVSFPVYRLSMIKKLSVSTESRKGKINQKK